MNDSGFRAKNALKYFEKAEKNWSMIGIIPKSDLSEDIKQALEKRIPKKPQLEGDGYADGQLVYDTWICKACGKEYELDYDKYKHCPECGQAIDWSEYVEEKTEEK